MESIWNGEGIPKPGISGYATGVRTAAFGILETILGYTYSDTTSKTWADTVRDTLLKVQVSAFGYFSSTNNGIVDRPVTAGMWFAAWDPYNAAPPPSILDNFIDLFGMKHEYDGLIPGNMETLEITLDFFNVYQTANP